MLHVQLIVVIGMGPVVALKYFRFTYRPSAINVLQRLERQNTNFGSIETPTKTSDISLPMSRTGSDEGSVYEPLLFEANSYKQGVESTTSSDSFHKKGAGSITSLDSFHKKGPAASVSTDCFSSGPSRVLSAHSRNKNK